MKKLLVYLLLSTMFSAMLVSCKYEDGPMLSFIPADKRVSGTWTFEKVIETNSSGASSDVTANYAGNIFDVNEDNTGIFTSTGSVSAFTWQFDDKKKNFIYVMNATTYTGKVLRLKNDEFWLEVKDVPTAGTTSEFHLKQ